MTQNHDNTVSRKGKHLTYSERCQIAILKRKTIPTVRLRITWMRAADHKQRNQTRDRYSA